MTIRVILLYISMVDVLQTGLVMLLLISLRRDSNPMRRMEKALEMDAFFGGHRGTCGPDSLSTIEVRSKKPWFFKSQNYFYYLRHE